MAKLQCSRLGSVVYFGQSQSGVKGILVGVDFFDNWVIDCLLADVTDVVEPGERGRIDAS
jgi:hypothetical protein